MSSHRRLRISRFSRALTVICLVLIPAAPIAAFLMSLFAPIDDLAASAGVTPPEASGALEAGRLMFGVVTLISALPLSFGLLRLAACFKGFADDALFAATTIAGLRDFAAAMLVWAVSQPFFMMIAGLVLTMGGPEGSRQLALRLSSDTVLLAVFALCVLTVSWVLTEASSLSEENAQFI